jgi:GntR family transcriptional regulator
MPALLPKYRQVADALAAEIAAGRLKSGDQVPSERVIAEEMGISRMTARQALRHLADRGVVQARVGQGTFVDTRLIQQELATLTGFTEEIERQGRAAGSVLVEATCKGAEPEVAQALGLSQRAEIWRIKRVRLVDGEPVALETTHVAADLTPGLLDREDLSRSSLYAALRQHYDLQPASAEQTLAAGLADDNVAPPLGLTVGAAVMQLTRLTRDARGRAFEFVRSVYRGDVFVMKVRLDLNRKVP